MDDIWIFFYFSLGKSICSRLTCRLEAEAVETLIADELATKAIIGRAYCFFLSSEDSCDIGGKKVGKVLDRTNWRWGADDIGQNFFLHLLFSAASYFIPNILYTHSNVRKRIWSLPFFFFQSKLGASFPSLEYSTYP